MDLRTLVGELGAIGALAAAIGFVGWGASIGH